MISVILCQLLCQVTQVTNLVTFFFFIKAHIYISYHILIKLGVFMQITTTTDDNNKGKG